MSDDKPRASSRRKYRPKSYKSAQQDVTVITLLTVLSALIKLLESYGLISQFFNFLIHAWDERNAIIFTIIGATLILTMGYYLNYFKIKNQRLYGLTEIVISLIVSASVINRYLEDHSTKYSTSQFLGIVVPFLTAVYFTQRGFNNYFDGKKKSKKAVEDLATV